MFSTDPLLFQSGSDVQKRFQDYGNYCEFLSVIAYSKITVPEKTNLSSKIIIHAAVGDSIWRRCKNAYRIGIRILQQDKFEVISAQDPFETGVISWLLARKFKIPLQIQVHTDFFSHYFFKESWKNRVRVWCGKFLLPKAKQIRVVSERIKKSLIAWNPLLQNKIVMLPIFVDVKKIQSAKIKQDLNNRYPEFNFRILTAARISREKNIGLLLQSVAPLIKEDKQLGIVIVGDGPEQEQLKKTAQELNIESNIRFEPMTTDLVSFFKTANLFVITSNYEGYGRTAVEAMAAGVPVVMTDVGVAGELLIDDLDGLVVPVGDCIRLTEAIRVLLKDQAKRENLKNEAMKVVQSLPDKEQYLKNYFNVLSKII